MPRRKKPSRESGNVPRLQAERRELREKLDLILRQREQDSDWHNITELGQFETREEARAAFNGLRAQYEALREEIAAIVEARTLLEEDDDRLGDIDYRAAPPREAMDRRPHFSEAIASAVYQAIRSDGVQSLRGDAQSGGVFVDAEDINLRTLHRSRKRTEVAGGMFAEWDVGSTGGQGLGLPPTFMPGTPPAFGSGLFAIDFFETRAFTMPNSAAVRWNARTANANIGANFKLAARSSVADQRGESTVQRLSDQLTPAMVQARATWQAIDASTELLEDVMDDLQYEYSASMSWEAIQGDGDPATEHNRGFGYYTGGTAGTIQALGAIGVLGQFHNELSASDGVTSLMALRSTLASRGWPPMVAMMTPEFFEPFTSTQVSDGTPFDSAFGALFAQMQQSLRGMRLAEVVRGFPAVDGASDVVAYLYPFSGVASAIHYARGFRVQEDPYSLGDNAQTVWRLYCEDALRISQPIAIGELRSAAS